MGTPGGEVLNGRALLRKCLVSRALKGEQDSDRQLQWEDYDGGRSGGGEGILGRGNSMEQLQQRRGGKASCGQKAGAEGLWRTVSNRGEL